METELSNEFASNLLRILLALREQKGTDPNNHVAILSKVAEEVAVTLEKARVPEVPEIAGLKEVLHVHTIPMPRFADEYRNDSEINGNVATPDVVEEDDSDDNIGNR